MDPTHTKPSDADIRTEERKRAVKIVERVAPPNGMRDVVVEAILKDGFTEGSLRGTSGSADFDREPETTKSADTTPSDADICRAVGWKHNPSDASWQAWVVGPGCGEQICFKSLATDLIAVSAACDATGLDHWHVRYQEIDGHGGEWIWWFYARDIKFVVGAGDTMPAAIHAALCELIKSGWRK